MAGGLASSMLVPWLIPNSMLVVGGTMHARECQGMLVGAGDLLRQIVATKGTRKEQEEPELEKVPKMYLKAIAKKESQKLAEEIYGAWLSPRAPETNGRCAQGFNSPLSKAPSKNTKH